MDFFAAVTARRSIRQFQPAPVPRDVLEKIVLAGAEAPSGCNTHLKHFIVVDDPALLEQIRPMSGALKTAPAVVLLVMDPQPTPYGEFWVQDASAAMENMLLAAVALGYAACWVEGGVRKHEDALRQLLGVPAGLRIWSLLPVGLPAAQPARPAKPSPAEITHYNRFTVRQ